MKGIFAVLALLVAVTVVGWQTRFPTGSASARVSATISIDGGTFTSSAIWHVTSVTQWGFDAGTNFRNVVDGDAIEFALAPNETLYLMRRFTTVLQCAREQSPGKETPAEALNSFTAGDCTIEPDAGFVLAKTSDLGPPKFILFYWKEGALVPKEPIGGNPQPEAASVAARNFSLDSMHVEATNAPVGSGLVDRSPWILDLPRMSCGFGCSHWSSRYVYAEYFTTVLP